MTHNDVYDDDNISILELIASVKPAFYTAVVTGIALGIAAFIYASTLDKEYQANAQFIINESAGSQFPTLDSALSGFLPTSGASSEAVLTPEKIMSRNFIVSLFDKTGINDDPYFTGAGKTSGPFASIKNTIFGTKEQSSSGLIEEVVATFRNVVSVNLNNNGIISVNVTHSDRAAAARIANQIVQHHLDNIEAKRLKSNRRQIDLLESQLIEAQKALDEALEDMRVYAVRNSVRSKEDLGASSLRLNRFRKETERLSAMLRGISYLEEQRQNSASQSFEVDDFSVRHPIALIPLQREFGWQADDKVVSFPSSARLSTLKSSSSNEFERLQRTLRLMEEEAVQNAVAAGKLTELERNVEVRQAIYKRLVSQFEARDLGAKLQTEQGEWLQAATPPQLPSAPRSVLIALIVAVLSGLFVVLARLAQVLNTGTLHSTSRIAQAFRAFPAADNIGSSVGRRSKPLSTLARQAGQLDHVGLVDMAITLRNEKFKTLMILGVPRTPVVHNLAATLGSWIADENQRVAVVDLARKKRGTREDTMHSHGVMVESGSISKITSFSWVELGKKDKKSVSLDEALARMSDEFASTIIAGAPLGRSVLKNKLAMSQADRVLVVASKGRTTQRDIDWVAQLLSHVPDIRTDLILD